MIFFYQEPKDRPSWFLLNDVVNELLVNMSYSGFPGVDGLLFGLSTFSNMACAFYLIKEEILKSVRKPIDRIFSSNPRVSAVNSFHLSIYIYIYVQSVSSNVSFSCKSFSYMVH